MTTVQSPGSAAAASRRVDPDPWWSDPLRERLTELRDILDHSRFGFPGQRWDITEGPDRGRKAVQTSGGHFVGPELPPGRTVRMRTRLKAPRRVGRIELAGERLDCHVFSRFPFRLRCDGREVARCDDPPIIRGRILTGVLPELVPGRVHELDLTIDVPDNLVAYGFRLAFSTPLLRERWHDADRAWARLLLATEQRPDLRPAVLAAINERAEEFPAATVDTLPDLLSEVLPPVRADLEPFPEVHLVGHAHLDLEWLWNWDQAGRAAKAVCARAVELLDSHPDLCFSLSQPVVYEMLRAEEPALMDSVQRLIDGGRWEPLTATWVEHDMNVPSAESVARQLTEGLRYSEQVLGVRPRVCVAADTFGHPATLPGLLARAGCTAYFHTRCHPLPRHGGPAYRWTGPDGSSVIGVVTDAYDGELLHSRVAEAAVQARRAGLDVGVLFFDIDGHTGQEVREGLARLARHASGSGLPAARPSRLDTFVDAVARGPLPDFQALPPTISEGAYTTQAVAKQSIRQAESALLEAEALSCMAGLDQRRELRQAWRALLFRQNHDTAAGTAMADVYTRLAADSAAWSRTVARLRDASLARLPLPPDADLVVANPTPWQREEWIRADDAVLRSHRAPTVAVSAGGERFALQRTGTGTGFLAPVGPWEVGAFRLEEGEQPPAPPDAILECGSHGAPEVFVGEENRKEFFAVRNRFFSLLVRGDAGAIVSLTMREGHRELVAYGTRRRTTFPNTARPELGLNVLQIARERPHAMSAWHLHEVHQEVSLIHTGRTSWREQGPLRAVLRTEHTVGATSVVQDLTVYRDLPRIDVTLHVDWHEPVGDAHGAAALKVACTPDLPAARVHAAAAAGVVEVSANGQERPMQRWVDVGDGAHGVALVSEDRFGYDALGPRVRMTVLRSAYDPAAGSDLGSHTFRYSIVPHPGTWQDARLPLLAERLVRPVVVGAPGRPAAQAQGRRPVPVPLPVPLPVPTADSSGLVGAVKRADGGDGLIYRVADWSGRGGRTTLEGLPPDVECRRTTLTEQPGERLPVDAGRLTVTLAPWAFETFLLRSPSFSPAAPPRPDPRDAPRG
ncbi:hypothetical protein OG896_06130 [Streptomyces sp. NBC_00669]|uniref:glycoside hydrolase family 38 N-terminal domain-containing protein n=1 Tax=Streptomyces sp. NBC_00669 TaxID=2976011 RepID=UPI002E30FED2|nr:glycoside hydrolase family 38 C-terminal domain-containing protein [Streptomyces sp. NBC_00669]